MFSPRAVASAIVALRGTTCAMLDGLADDQLDLPALPDWSVADVFRHLAEGDRGSVQVRSLRHFLPGKDLFAYERVNDDALSRLRAAPRAQLRRELQTWGRRLAMIVRVTPTPLGRIRIPSAFGTLPLAWFGVLRLYDEWVHQYDVATAVGAPDPELPGSTADMLAQFHLAAVKADALNNLATRPGVVEVAVGDATRVRPWRFDLTSRDAGPGLAQPASVEIACDVGAWCLLAADRLTWQDLEEQGRLKIVGDDRAAAEALLDVVRVV